jgi:hypothetical protein
MQAAGRKRMTQRWLSLIGICDLLSTTEKNIKWLVKNGYLEMIPGRGNGKYLTARFLDPSPEYAQRLKLAETIYGRRQILPAELNIPGASIFTITELAEILGWSAARASRLVVKRKIVSVAGGPKLRYFSATQIRNILWKRTDRKQAYQRAPYLLQELIDYFWRYEANQRKLVPSDAAFAEDDLLMKKWELMARMDPEDRDLAMQEFLEKVRAAKDIAASLKK